MIPKKVLRELVNPKLKDADILLLNRRYDSAFYIAGYALEIALNITTAFGGGDVLWALPEFFKIM